MEVVSALNAPIGIKCMWAKPNEYSANRCMNTAGILKKQF
jgi:hypothetical protein